MRIPLIGSYNRGRSVIVNPETCMNLYPEMQPQTSKNQIVLVGTPGLKLFIDTGYVCRCLHATTNGKMFSVNGRNVYVINETAAKTLLGTMASATGIVKTAENMNLNYHPYQTAFVDGTKGYIYDFSNNTFTEITSGYEAGTHIVYIDGYFIQNIVNTNKFIYSTLYNGKEWDSALDVYFAEGSADNIEAVEKLNNQLWVFGSQTTEVWQPTGVNTAPFERIAPANMDIGIGAKYSVAVIGGSIFWLGAGRGGNNIVWKASGFSPERVSTNAIEYLLGQMSDVSDAVAYAYSDEGHFFYVLNFPTGDKTLVYDLTTGLWHQRGFLDTGTGMVGRHRSIVQCFWNNKNYVGDYADGKIYNLNLDYYSDNSTAIHRERTTPNISFENKLFTINYVEVEMERGIGLNTGQGSAPIMMIQSSKDGGKTWGSELHGSIGAMGKYKTRIKFNRLGSGRDRVLKFSISDPVKCVLVDGYADVEVEE